MNDKIKFHGLKCAGKGAFLTLIINGRHYTHLLKGALRNLCLFSQDNTQLKLKISKRGTKEASKYFLIPRGFRDINEKDIVSFQRIENGNKFHYIYSIKKGRESK